MPDKTSRRREQQDDLATSSRPHDPVERQKPDAAVVGDALSLANPGLAMGAMGGAHQIAMLQSLQRTAENAAVEHLVAQRAVAMAPAIALTDKDIDAIAEQVHTAIEGLGTDEEAVYSALEKLGKNQPMINKMKASYKTQFKADRQGARGRHQGRVGLEQERAVLRHLSPQRPPPGGKYRCGPAGHGRRGSLQAEGARW